MAGILTMICGCAMPLKMDAPTPPDLSQLKTCHRSVALYIPPELKNYEYVLATSPVDKMAYPLGDQTMQLFQQCSEKIFKEVVIIDTMASAGSADLVLRPTIVNFDAKVPMPAYKPYSADMVYRMEVLTPDGDKIFTQTAVGKAQTSKGMMSGFSARSICAQVAQMAMADAAGQIMEGMVEAEELAPYFRD